MTTPPQPGKHHNTVMKRRIWNLALRLSGGLADSLAHDPEKFAAVFRKDHAQTIS
jgi:hypothetical protein